MLVIKKIDEINQKMAKLKAELDENMRMKEIYESNKNKEETKKTRANKFYHEKAPLFLNFKILTRKNINLNGFVLPASRR
jgi:Skp family chaperone for outer membrane proteins